jgi:hypothetical protein
MSRTFNTEGAIIKADHYHIDPLSRLDWEEVQHLIKTKKYFVLHAPRQTGKTTTMRNMMHALNYSTPCGRTLKVNHGWSMRWVMK